MGHSGDWHDSGSMGHSGDQDSVSAPQTLEQYISVMSPPLPNFPYYSDEPNCAAACGTSGYSSTTEPQVETVWTGQWVMETSEAGSVCSGASPDGVTNISSLVVRSDECAPLICLTIISNEYDGEQIRMSSIQLPSCDNPRKFKHFRCELPCEATDFSSIDAAMAELQCHVDEGEDMEFEDPDQLHAGGCLKATAAPLNAPDSVHPDHSGSMHPSGDHHSGDSYGSGSMDYSGDHHSGDWYGSDSGSMGHSGDQDSVSAPQTLEQYISVMSPPLPFFSYYSDVPM